MRKIVPRFALCGLLILLLLGLSTCRSTLETSNSPADIAPVTETPPVAETAESPSASVAGELLWPELDGFSLSADDSTMAVYNAKDNPNAGVIAMVAMSGSEARLDAFQNGWSAETEAFLTDTGMLPGAVATHKSVSLPLLNQEGIELTLSVQNVHMQVLYFISQDQLIQVQGYGLPEDKDIIQAACDQFASRVSLA